MLLEKGQVSTFGGNIYFAVDGTFFQTLKLTQSAGNIDEKCSADMPQEREKWGVGLGANLHLYVSQISHPFQQHYRISCQTVGVEELFAMTLD